MKSKKKHLRKFPFLKLSKKDAEWVDETLSQMSLHDKCAQMVMPWVLGDYKSEDSPEYQRIASLVKDSKVGGIIFFRGDVLNEAALIKKLQKLADTPLLVASDFERGLAMRLTDATEFPYNMAVAATGDPSLAYKMGKAIGDECRVLGVQQNYAPVVDVNNNAENPIINIRSFSEDKDIVSTFSKAFIQGEESAKIISTAKHFPGHGNTQVDSHQDVPVIEGSEKELNELELIPFEESIKSGVQSVMVGHLSVPALDDTKNLPATLSKPIITGLLKGKLGFNGLVVTDAMNMSAVTKYYSVAEASVMAVKAGNDILLMPPDEDVAINAIQSAVEEGEIEINRINESVTKILAAKKWLKIGEEKKSALEDLSKVISNKAHLRLAKEIADKSITLVKNDRKIVPVNPSKYYSTACISITDGVEGESDLTFQKLADENFGYVRKIFINKHSTKKDYQKAYQIARKANLILLPSFIKVKAYQGTVQLSDKNVKFIKKLLRLRAPSVIISFGNPYLLSLFPQAKTYLCAYGDPIVSQQAAMEAVLGDIDIQGILPISIPNSKYKIGDGIKIDNTSLKISEQQDSTYDFSKVDSMMEAAIEKHVFPGGVLLIGKGGKVIYEKPFGHFTYDENSTADSKETIFDLASVSKVVGTTTAAMILYDKGKLKLDEKVSHYLPAFAKNGKEDVTVRNLLLHNSGLIPYRDYMSLYKTKDEVINSIMNEKLQYSIGSETVYSDLNMIVLQQILEKISGKPLDVFLKENVFKPLNMNRTMYNPPKELWYYCPPTSLKSVGEKRNKGVVHDGNAFILGGVSGHAGLFSTAEDLAVFLQMMMQNGKYGEKQIVKTSTVKQWTKRQSPESSRGIGWDTKSEEKSSAGVLFSKNSFGHTGYTGTSLWVDRNRDLFVILLTNRVYPDENNTQIIDFRPRIHDAIVNSIEN